MTEETSNATPPAENPAENTQTTPPAADTPTPAADNPATPANDDPKAPETKTDGAFSFPAADDTEAVLNFRKQCGYPDEASGYGLPMETDEQKDVLNFIHKCQLDPIAAKVVVDNLALEIAEQEKQAKAQYDQEYAKVSAAWGDSKKGNESLVSKGCEVIQITDDQLRGISDIIGVEAALGLMMTVGKLKSDYSGVGGTAGSDSESIEDFIASKRRR